MTHTVVVVAVLLLLLVVVVVVVVVVRCVPKNDTDVTHYRFNPHQPISIIFGRDAAEKVCY